MPDIPEEARQPAFEPPLGEHSTVSADSKDAIPEEAPQAAADELMEAFANVQFRFWTCLNKEHKAVTWAGDIVASCDTCGLTSGMKDAWTKAVREHERRRVAERIAVKIEKVIGGYPDNLEVRPKYERGGFLNDGQWAAAIARQIGEGRD